MTNSWRALARMARDRLVKSDPADLTLILGVSSSYSWAKKHIIYHFTALAPAPVMSCPSTPFQPNFCRMYESIRRAQCYRSSRHARICL